MVVQCCLMTDENARDSTAKDFLTSMLTDEQDKLQNSFSYMNRVLQYVLEYFFCISSSLSMMLQDDLNSFMYFKYENRRVN